MAWRIVKQPNGLYGRFSDIVDNFTHMNLTAAEVFDVCLDICGREESHGKIERADADEVYLGTEAEEPKDGLRRWRECLETIKEIHEEDLQDTIDSGSMPAEEITKVQD